MFQHTAARRRLADTGRSSVSTLPVSTHSRPKAAGRSRRQSGRNGHRFNTQPPEGGWLQIAQHPNGADSFNTQPPEGGWLSQPTLPRLSKVSTHSRPKAAGTISMIQDTSSTVSTHSRPKAAGSLPCCTKTEYSCFNTQPPEGGWNIHFEFAQIGKSFNTQPPEGGWAGVQEGIHGLVQFQHTAARRRLVIARNSPFYSYGVSTHSRPKAAGTSYCCNGQTTYRFNTQPPEGGWFCMGGSKQT